MIVQGLQVVLHISSASRAIAEFGCILAHTKLRRTLNRLRIRAVNLIGLLLASQYAKPATDPPLPVRIVLVAHFGLPYRIFIALRARHLPFVEHSVLHAVIVALTLKQLVTPHFIRGWSLGLFGLSKGGHIEQAELQALALDILMEIAQMSGRSNLSLDPLPRSGRFSKIALKARLALVNRAGSLV